MQSDKERALMRIRTRDLAPEMLEVLKQIIAGDTGGLELSTYLWAARLVHEAKGVEDE